MRVRHGRGQCDVTCVTVCVQRVREDQCNAHVEAESNQYTARPSSRRERRERRVGCGCVCGPMHLQSVGVAQLAHFDFCFGIWHLGYMYGH